MGNTTASTSTPINSLKELRDYLNLLDEKSLNQPIRFWGESKSENIVSIALLHEDFFNPSGEGCEPVGVYLSDPEYGQDFVDGEGISYPAGTILLESEDVSGSITYNR